MRFFFFFNSIDYIIVELGLFIWFSGVEFIYLYFLVLYVFIVFVNIVDYYVDIEF